MDEEWTVYEELLVKYLMENKKREIQDILDGAAPKSVYIFGQDLLNLDVQQFCKAMNDPMAYLPHLDTALTKAAKHMAEEAHVERLRLRISNLPSIPFFQRSKVPRCEDTGRIVQFRGTVTKTKARLVLWWRKHTTCQSCGESCPIEADYDQFYEYDDIPPRCPSQDCNGRLGNESPQAPEDCKDIQDVKVQLKEQPQGSVPQSLWVTLEEDLVDSVMPGDEVELVGVIRRRWYPLGKGLGGRTDLELWMQANSVNVVNVRVPSRAAREDAAAKFKEFWLQPEHADLAGRDVIIAHFCPQVFGLHRVKLALAVVLAGGVERIDTDGTRVRGEPHILLVGDPGTAKSQLLRYCCNLTPRSVFVNGAGTSNAGLTVAASRLIMTNRKSSDAFQGRRRLAAGGGCPGSGRRRPLLHRQFWTHQRRRQRLHPRGHGATDHICGQSQHDH